jgi:hypothetical protein
MTEKRKKRMKPTMYWTKRTNGKRRDGTRCLIIYNIGGRECLDRNPIKRE